VTYTHGWLVKHHNYHKGSPWAAEQDAALIKYWNEDELSSTEITRKAEFSGFSRSAIVGRVKRLRTMGMPMRERVKPMVRKIYVHNRPHGPIARRRRLVVQAPAVALMPELSALPDNCSPVGILGVSGCRWPVNDAPAAALLFCDGPRQRGPYCPFHTRLARRHA